MSIKKIILLDFVLGISFLLILHACGKLLESLDLPKPPNPDHTFLMKQEINSTIIGISYSKIFEIRIKGINKWIHITGIKYIPNSQNPLKEPHFLVGDSICKKRNSYSFYTVSNSKKYYWSLEKW